ncbi:septation protein IspZ [Thalassotalea montiporae]
MRLWTYERPFEYGSDDYKIIFSFTLSTYTSQLFCNNTLIDQVTGTFVEGLPVIKHKVEPPANQDVDASSESINSSLTKPITVSVGYFSLWNVGIEVSTSSDNEDGNELIYTSHPGKDIYYGEKKVGKLNSAHVSPQTQAKMEIQRQKWQQNKHSIFADIGLGLAFFVVAKITGDLTLAALTGVTLGLALVVTQRFVKVDLLGGFAVFGTVMLMISGIFSLVFQSEYLVQLKGTFMGIISASVLLIDGLFRKGSYFGARFERYLNSPIEHQFFVIGLAVIGAIMAGVNYLVANYMSEGSWLNYDTFLETPLYFLLFFTLVWRAGMKHQTANSI